MVDLLARHGRIMAVGDDAQAIYSWRGAGVENIHTFPVRHPGARISAAIVHVVIEPALQILWGCE